MCHVTCFWTVGRILLVIKDSETFVRRVFLQGSRLTGFCPPEFFAGLLFAGFLYARDFVQDFYLLAASAHTIEPTDMRSIIWDYYTSIQ